MTEIEQMARTVEVLKSDIRAHIDRQDKRSARFDLVEAQLQYAYADCCSILNHLNVVGRYEKLKGKKNGQGS